MAHVHCVAVLLLVEDDLNLGGGVEFAADAPVESGALEGVGRLPLLRLGVALRADVLLGYPFAGFRVADFDGAVEAVADELVRALPAHRAVEFVENLHIYAGVLVEKKVYFDDAVPADGLRYADVNLVGGQ